MIDKPRRSILKAITWRLTGTVDTILLSWLITRKITIALSIGFLEIFTKMFLYYLHERAWNKIKLGREAANPQEYHINRNSL